MTKHFSHHLFENYDFESVPLNRDVYLMDDEWLPDWESAYLDLFDGKGYRNVGYISRAAIRNAGPEALEISWYPNVFDRFHEVTVFLPRDAFVACVNVYNHDEKPHIFVKKEWLSSLHLRPYSAFALLDAIGVKNAIRGGQLTPEKLIQLREQVDNLADTTQGIAFVSFADNLLLKANWYVGQYDSDVSYSYEPESLINAFTEVARIYRDVLGMGIYATITQGVNEYADPALIHISPNNAHISLNSLGVPFAQLLAIDGAARAAIRSWREEKLKGHPPCELYVDDFFLHSLRFKHSFDKRSLPIGTYEAPMSSEPGKYYCVSAQTILDNLDSSH